MWSVVRSDDISHDVGLEDGTLVAEVFTGERHALLVASAPRLLGAVKTMIEIKDQYSACEDLDDKRSLIDAQLNHYKHMRQLIKEIEGC